MVNGVDLAIKDQDGFTAAELAEYNGHNQCAKYLRTVENMVLCLMDWANSPAFRASIRSDRFSIDCNKNFSLLLLP